MVGLDWFRKINLPDLIVCRGTRLFMELEL